ncbi:CBS domain-containing protein [Candidatus Woesearchaeota archaeon]|nr:CBS domain-containing protein [Candidatus Woesearchaeota archaeon]
MTPYDISEIKSVRKKLGMTQSELAKKADVSQSLIAKIESEKLDPTLSNANKIFNALDSLQKKESLKAKDFIHKGVVSCQEDEFVKDVIKKMKRHEISQLPVMKGDSIVGVVSETRIIDHLIDDPNQNLKISDVMGDVPPIVSMSTDESVISSLLRVFSLVIVQDKGKIRGLITRSDILRKIYG